MACLRQDEDQDAETQRQLDCEYVLGKNCEHNYKKAFELFKHSADRGNASAKNDLGTMYANGYGIEKDDGMAFKLFKERRKPRN